LLATLGLTLVRDLTTGIVAGCVLATLFAIARASLRGRGSAD
jgi:sulfate permease, SulP family